MLSGFRKAITSRVGLIITMVAVGIIGLAFAMSDVSMMRVGPTGAPTEANVAEVAGTAISQRALQDEVNQTIDQVRAQNPELTLAQFVEQGGLDGVLDRMMDQIALERFAEASGILVSDRLIDGQIASIPAFQGFNGEFSQEAFERVLAAQRITPDRLRADLRRSIIAQWLTAPLTGARHVPQQLALAYSSVLLERRIGSILLVSTKDMDPGPLPNDQQLQQFYQANRARYTLPERRVLRYAVVTRASLGDRVTPTDAEIATAYKEQAARYQPSEQRDIAQVIVADQAAAARIAQAVRGGTAIEAAATAAGLSATTIEDATRESLTASSSADVVNAVFGAAEGAVVGPVRSPLGFHVAVVRGIERIPGRSLEQARPELVEALTEAKTRTALTEIQERIDDGINGGSTFDEIVAEAQLTGQRTPAVFATGRTVDLPADATVDPALARVAAGGFAMEEGDDPQLIAIGEEGDFALVGVERVVAAAPRPLAEIRDGVASDYRIENAKRQARERADRILAAVNGGSAIGQAASAAGVGGTAQQVDLRRGQLTQFENGIPAQLAMLFSLRAGEARVLEAPGNAGYFVVRLDRAERGNAAADPVLLARTQGSLSQIVGNEYAQQFAQAVRRGLGAQRNDEAVASLRNTLTGRVEE